MRKCSFRSGSELDDMDGESVVTIEAVVLDDVGATGRSSKLRFAMRQEVVLPFSLRFSYSFGIFCAFSVPLSASFSVAFVSCLYFAHLFCAFVDVYSYTHSC